MRRCRLFVVVFFLCGVSVSCAMEGDRRHHEAQLAQLVEAFERAEGPEAKEQAKKDMLACYKHEFGKSSLHFAVALGHLSLAKSLYEQQPLDKRHAFVNKQSIHGATALHWAAPCCEEVVCAHVQIVQWLLEQGACVATKDKRGRTPLHCAVEWHNENVAEMIALLLDNNPSIVNETTRIQATALDIAIKRKSYNVARVLLHYGAPILRDDNGTNAFHMARDTEAVQLLITAPHIAQLNTFWQKESKRIVSLWLCLQRRSVPKDIRKLLCTWLVYADLDELVGSHLEYVSQALQQEAEIVLSRDFVSSRMIPWEYVSLKKGLYSQGTIEMLRMTDDQLKERYERQIRKGYVPLLHNKLRFDVGDQHEK